MICLRVELEPTPRKPPKMGEFSVIKTPLSHWLGSKA